MNCPYCKNGQFSVPMYSDSRGFYDDRYGCAVCKATGVVPEGFEDRVRFGQMHRAVRLDAGMSLRACAERYEIDVCLLSAFERGAALEDFVAPFDRVVRQRLAYEKSLEKPEAQP